MDAISLLEMDDICMHDTGTLLTLAWIRKPLGTYVRSAFQSVVAECKIALSDIDMHVEGDPRTRLYQPCATR